MTAAENHCQDMATHNFFSHYGSDGSSPGTRMTRAGYSARAGGENIAWGYPSVAAVMDGWEHSSGHYNNIVSSAYQEAGFARCGTNIWVADFAAPASGTRKCITATTPPPATTPTPTPTPTPPPATTPDPGIAVYNSCKKYTAGWYYFPSTNTYRTWWNNSCYQYNGNTGRTYILRKNSQGNWRFFPI
jgi:hypothetical protein